MITIFTFNMGGDRCDQSAEFRLVVGASANSPDAVIEYRAKDQLGDTSWRPATEPPVTEQRVLEAAVRYLVRPDVQFASDPATGLRTYYLGRINP